MKKVLSKINLKKHKKVLSFAVAFLLLLNFFSVGNLLSANAAPIGFTEIRTAAELAAIGTSKATRAGNYWLANDIDVSHINWQSIGTFADGFTGTFDGNGKVISGLWSSGKGSNAGLFASLRGASVYNLTISLHANGITGSGERKGALSGNAYSGTVIDNVHIVGSQGGSPIHGSANYIAGLVGVVNDSTIKNSSVSNVDLQGGSYVAGLIGVAYGYGKTGTISLEGNYVYNIAVRASASYGAGFAGALYEGAVALDGHVNNASIQCGAAYGAGFVSAQYNNAQVFDSSVNNAYITTKGRYAGGFVAALYNNAQLLNSHVENITVTSPEWYLGGFASVIYDKAEAHENSATNVNVSSTGTGGSHTGGFAANIYNTAKASHNYVYGATVSANGRYAAGFASTIYDRAEVTQSYAKDVEVFTGNYGAAGFASVIYNNALVGCTGVTGGTVTARGTGVGEFNYSAGGYAAGIRNDAVVNNAYTVGVTVTGTGNTGGFAGNIWYCASINNTYAHSNVYGTSSANTGVGGYVGYHQVTSTKGGIFNSYTASTVAGTGSNIGAFTGYSQSTSQYKGTNYYDTDLSGALPAIGNRVDPKGSLAPMGRSTSEMLRQATFSGWSFGANPWGIDEGISYPYLEGCGTGGGIVKPVQGTVKVFHVDSSDNSILLEETFTVAPGSYGPYESTTFADYGPGVLAAGSAPASGIIARGETVTIVYGYEKINTNATIIVEHRDMDDGNLLWRDELIVPAGPYGPYNTYTFPDYLAGYHVAASAPPSGTISAGETILIVFGYEKIPSGNGTIIVEHRDLVDGSLILREEFIVPTGPYGPYNAYPFTGYTAGEHVATSAPPSGTIAAGETILIIFGYEMHQQFVTITYDPNGGYGSINQYTHNKDEYYTIVDQGYYAYNLGRFQGWNTQPDGSGTFYANGDTIYLDDDITLYAMWGW